VTVGMNSISSQEHGSEQNILNRGKGEKEEEENYATCDVIIRYVRQIRFEILN
jgi:hypothetical protein